MREERDVIREMKSQIRSSSKEDVSHISQRKAEELIEKDSHNSERDEEMIQTMTTILSSFCRVSFLCFSPRLVETLSRRMGVAGIAIKGIKHVFYSYFTPSFRLTFDMCLLHSRVFPVRVERSHIQARRNVTLTVVWS